MPPKKIGTGTLVLVPGIMGSSLQASGVDHSGVPRTEVIWGERLVDVFSTLAMDPAILGAEQVVATGVMREVRLGRARVSELYGKLMDYCCRPWGLDLVEGKSFRSFPYDWRADLRVTASKLHAFVGQLRPPIYIVAHSMGGLVTRLMLNANPSTTSQIGGVFQIASPVAGSSKAFVSLRRQLQINPMADAIWEHFHSLDLTKQGKLTRAIGSMTSLYQLLPPESAKILLKSGGTMTSAVDFAAWPEGRAMIVCARETHKLLEVAPSVPIRCVFSTANRTDWLVCVDNNWSVLGVQARADGDGTVTSASAQAVSTDITHIPNGDTEHTKMCSNTDVHAHLKAFLS
jgi:predicted alpha/beta hydrolase family esterase